MLNLDTTDGSLIPLWLDESGLGAHASQTDANKLPQYRVSEINGHGVLRFDGADDWYKINQLASTLSDHATILAIFRPRSQAGDGYYLSSHFGGSNRIKFGHRSNGELIYDDDGTV